MLGLVIVVNGICNTIWVHSRENSFSLGLEHIWFFIVFMFMYYVFSLSAAYSINKLASTQFHHFLYLQLLWLLAFFSSEKYKIDLILDDDTFCYLQIHIISFMNYNLLIYRLFLHNFEFSYNILFKIHFVFHSYMKRF